METERVPGTSVTLLRGLRDGTSNTVAWGVFVERYGPVIMAWCRRWGLQEADAADVTQDILLTFPVRLREFEYDPRRRFRDYLRRAVHNALLDFIARRQRSAAGSGDTRIHDLLASVEAREDLVHRLNDTFDREILEEGLAQVRARVEPATWQAYWRTAFENQTPADVAASLGMTPGAVYQARSRVQGMVEEAVQRLEADSDA